MKSWLRALGIAILLCAPVWAQGAPEIPFRDGKVIEIVSVRIAPGKIDEYHQFLVGAYARIMKECRAQGLIEGYSFFSRTPDGSEMYLTTEFRDVAALEGFPAKKAVIAKRVFGESTTIKEQEALRDNLRIVRSYEFVRELVPAEKISCTDC